MRRNQTDQIQNQNPVSVSGSIFARSGRRRPHAPERSRPMHTVLETDSAPTTVIIFDDHFLVRQNIHNQPFHCFSVRDFSTRENLQPKYNIPTKGRWLGWETFSPAFGNPHPILFKQKFGPALFILEKDCPFLTVYDLDNGEGLNRLYLDPLIKYTSINRCGNDLSRYVIEGSNGSLPPNIALDFIVFDYPPLRASFRCQVTKAAFPKSTGVETSGYFICATYSTSIEIFDMKSIQSREFEYPPDLQVMDSNAAIRISHYVHSKPPVLLRVNSCYQGHMKICTWESPPYFITKNKHGSLRVINSDGADVGNQGLLDLNVPGCYCYESTFDFHPDESSRLIICGENRIRVLKLLRRGNSNGQGGSYLEQEFDFPPIMQSPPTQLNSCARRNGLRPSHTTARTSLYIEEPEVGVKWEYHYGLDIFAIMQISKEALKFYLYDNQDWTPITVVEPRFWTASLKSNIFTVPLTTFDIVDSHMVVQIHESGRNAVKVYLASLLSEVVDEKNP
jgi:hypothetical protein